MAAVTAIYDRCLTTASAAAAALRNTLGMQTYDNPTDNSDEALAFIVDGAKQEADNYCQNDFLGDDDTELPIPEVVQQGVLKIAAARFLNRPAGVTDNSAGDLKMTFAATTVGRLEADVRRLLDPYRIDPGL